MKRILKWGLIAWLWKSIGKRYLRMRFLARSFSVMNRLSKRLFG